MREKEMEVEMQVEGAASASITPWFHHSEFFSKHKTPIECEYSELEPNSSNWNRMIYQSVFLFLSVWETDRWQGRKSIILLETKCSTLHSAFVDIELRLSSEWVLQAKLSELVNHYRPVTIKWPVSIAACSIWTCLSIYSNPKLAFSFELLLELKQERVADW